MTKSILITGAGGFIGGHLADRFLTDGHEVFCIDRKPMHEWYQLHAAAYNHRIAVEEVGGYTRIMGTVNEIYHLAEDMGGMGYLATNHLNSLNSVTNTIALLNAVTDQRVFFASSACVYPEYLQDELSSPALREDDAFPAQPDLGYGWEKLYIELLLKYHGLERYVTSRIARYHNVYGPHGSWGDGREKAPAAICRKVATAALTGERLIEIWGDGQQQRSFMYIDDCVEGTRLIMESDYDRPLNLGSSELVSINELVALVETIAFGATDVLERVYLLDKPQGVRGRNSNNLRISEAVGWAPSTHLFDGLIKTYEWIYDEVKADLKL